MSAYRGTLTRGADQAARTPPELWEDLDREFAVTYDPCPGPMPSALRKEGDTLRKGDSRHRKEGDSMSSSMRRCKGDALAPTARWGRCNYVNPPFDAAAAWLAKGVQQRDRGATCVFLLPARVWTRWFHELVVPYAAEVRFLCGYVRFDGYKRPLSTPLMLVVLRRGALVWSTAQILGRVRLTAPSAIPAAVHTWRPDGSRDVASVAARFCATFGAALGMRVESGKCARCASALIIHEAGTPIAPLLFCSPRWKQLAILLPARLNAQYLHEALHGLPVTDVVLICGQLRASGARPFVEGSIILVLGTPL